MFDDDAERAAATDAPAAARRGPGVVGKSTLTARLPPNPHRAVQAQGALGGEAVHAVAATGLAGAGDPFPFLDQLQAAFGHHDLGGVRAHVGGAAATASAALGARAYASGDAVAFASAPDLRLAAHEAAHVVQQRGGVRLAGGVGAAGDAYERHADEVADRVVRGESVEALLDPLAHRGAAGGPAVQRDAHSDEALRTLARLEAMDDGGPTAQPERRPAEGDGADPDVLSEAPAPRPLFTAPRGDAALDAALDTGDYAGATRVAGGGQASTLTAPEATAADLTEEDQAAVARMRANPLTAAPEAEAPPDPNAEPEEAAHGFGVTSDDGAVGAAYHGAPSGDQPGAHGALSVGTDGTVHASVAPAGGLVEASAEVNVRDRSASLEGRVGQEDGSHASAGFEIRHGELESAEVEAQLGDDDGAHATAGARLDRHGIGRLELGGQSGPRGAHRGRIGGRFVYEATYGDPEPKDGGFEVKVEFTLIAELTGAGRTRLINGAIGAGFDASQKLVRQFATEAEARQWIDGLRPRFDEVAAQLFAGHLSADAARALPVGETVETTRGGHANASATLGPVTLGARLAASHTLIYRAIDDHTFRVGYRDQWSVQGTAGGTTPILGGTGTREHAERQGRVVEFDLSTPAGCAALDRALRTDELPAGSGAGWRTVERSTGTTDRSQTDLQALGATGQLQSRVDVDRVVDANGQVDQRAVGTASMTAPRLPWDLRSVEPPDDATSTRVALGDAGNSLTSQVRIEDADAQQRALAAATGSEWALRREGGRAVDRGRWQARTQLSAAQMTRVWRQLRAGGGARHAHLLGTRAPLATTLAAAARAAADAEALRPAIARFVADGGEPAGVFLRTLAGGRTDYDLTLEGSTVFEGAAGRSRVARAIEALEARFATDPGDPALLADVRQVLREQQARIAAMGDEERFALPPAVRRRELALNRPLLADARALMAEVEAAARQRATTAAARRTAEEVAGDELGVNQSSEATNAAGRELAAQSHALLAAMGGDVQRMLAMRTRVVNRKAAALAETRVHFTASEGTGRSPHELFTGLTGTANGLYTTAHQHMQRAEAALFEARDRYAAYEDLRALVPAGGVLDAGARDRVDQVRRVSWALHTLYQRALEALDLACAAYLEIRRTHPGPQYWGRSHAPPADA